MNYIQALGEAYAGKETSVFSGELQAEIHRDREEMGRDGFTLVIEPLAEFKKFRMEELENLNMPEFYKRAITKATDAVLP
jgi:hypothetical protein